MSHSPPPDDEDDDAIEAAATMREAWIDGLRVRELACTEAIRTLLADAVTAPFPERVAVVALPIGNFVCTTWDEAVAIAASWGDPGEPDDDD